MINTLTRRRSMVAFMVVVVWSIIGFFPFSTTHASQTNIRIDSISMIVLYSKVCKYYINCLVLTDYTGAATDPCKAGDST